MEKNYPRPPEGVEYITTLATEGSFRLTATFGPEPEGESLFTDPKGIRVQVWAGRTSADVYGAPEADVAAMFRAALWLLDLAPVLRPGDYWIAGAWHHNGVEVAP